MVRRRVVEGPLPSFIIIGTEKSGSTSLFSALAAQPEFHPSKVKETNFFNSDERWGKGLSDYRRLFAGASPTQQAFEGSILYTSPSNSLIVAERMASVLPHIRLVAILRDPIERLRSHYRQNFMRGHEPRGFLDAVTVADSPYVASSCYYRCLLPYFERFPKSQIKLVRFEDVFHRPNQGWHDLLAFLDVPPRPLPAAHKNAFDGKREHSALMRRLYKPVNWRQVQRHARHLPRPLRSLGRNMLFRRESESYVRGLNEAKAPLPGDVGAAIWEDIARLQDWLGQSEPLWPHTKHVAPAAATGESVAQTGPRA